MPYSDLLQALDVSNVRELEDLIIDAIYLDLLHGKLDQKEEQLEVTYTMGRDLEPGKLEQILAALEDWQVHLIPCLAEGFLTTRPRASTTSAVLANLDGKINSIAADTTATKLNQQEHERILQLNLKDVYDKQKEKSLGGAMASRRAIIPPSERENMMMDIDEPDNKGKNRKYVIYVYPLSCTQSFNDSRASQEAIPKPSRKRNKF